MNTSHKFNLLINDNKYRKYIIIVVVLAPILFFLIMISTIVVFKNKIPAPRISNSESFNEKARWIQGNLATGCDVLIIGSSMALNNIDGSLLKEMTQAKSVLNLGSWGLTTSESEEILKYVVPLCKPKVIILSTYYGDFDNRPESINWKLFKDYVYGKSTVVTYLKSMDPIYYLSAYINRKHLKSSGNSIYQSLEFDVTGSVMFDCKNFQVDPARWDGQNKYQPLNPERTEANLSALISIENIAKDNHSQLLVVETPLRKVAEVTLFKPEIIHLWDAVTRSVNSAGFTFLKVRSHNDFSDEQFVDFVHLNKCGAIKAMKAIAPAVTKILNKIMQPAQ
jgi:hypothetical protein